MKHYIKHHSFGKLLLATLLSLLPCCVSYTRDITSDGRFEKILNVPIITKRELRLYRTVIESSRLFPYLEYDLTESESINDPAHELVGTIEIGHNVKFERAYSRSGTGEVKEWLVGSITK